MAQGQGWHGDSEGHAKAGKRGGDKVAQERGSEFFEDIGEASPTSFEEGSKRAKDAGEMGGRSSGDQNQ